MSDNTVFTIGSAATSDTIEEVLPLSEQGGTPITDIPVAPGTKLVITDIDVAAGGNTGSFKLQQDNGSGYFTLACLQVSGLGVGAWVMASPKMSWTIDGDSGPAVTIRLAVTTPTGPLPVACVMTGYRLMTPSP